MTGANQANSARDDRQRARERQDTASGVLGGAANIGGAQYAQQAGQAGQALGQQMGTDAATIGTQKATQAARTQGLNKGQAAITGAGQAGNLFTQGQTSGQGMGMNAYGQGAGNQINAATNLGGIGTANAEQAGKSGQAATQAGGSLLGAIGGLMSDEDSKEDIQKSPDIDDILSRVRPVSYKYKEGEGQGDGEHVGVIAQDLEKTPMKENVVDTPAGKMINGPMQEGSNLNLIVQLAGRIRELEDQIRGGK